MLYATTGKDAIDDDAAADQARRVPLGCRCRAGSCGNRRRLGLWLGWRFGFGLRFGLGRWLGFGWRHGRRLW